MCSIRKKLRMEKKAERFIKKKPEKSFFMHLFAFSESCSSFRFQTLLKTFESKVGQQFQTFIVTFLDGRT